MLATPEATPATIPEAEPTVAMPALLLVHVPPDVPSAKAVVAPTQADVPPVIASIGFTVTMADVLQPPLSR